MYLEYWGLTKHPFNNVPDPEMYFDMHQSVEQAVSELLFAIDEGDEVLAVVIGPVGAGKTMSLRIVLDTLDHDKYKIAFVTNPDMTFPQLLREIIGQLEGKTCEEKRRDQLLEVFNRLLFETSDTGKRIVIFIDEGNVIKPHNLESLRMLTNMQDDQQNLFTIVLAGQPELGKRLEDPRRANLFQRIGVYCKIQGIDSEATMRDYIEHRLERAGNKGRQIFTNEAYDALWVLSENGIPRIINKIAKLSLKAAETNKLKEVNADVINAIGGRFMRTYAKQAKMATIKPEIQPLEEQPIIESASDNAGKMQPDKGAKDIKATVEPEDSMVQTPSEIAPPAEDLKNAEAVATTPTPRKEAIAPKRLSDKEIEDLASRLATERVKGMKHTADPFEEWEKARTDIINQIKAKQMAGHDGA